MSLRSKLLVSFILISITVLALCGLLSYRIAQDIDKTREGEITLALMKDTAALLAPQLQNVQFDPEGIEKSYAPLSSPTKFIIISDSSGLAYHHCDDSRLLELVKNHLKTATDNDSPYQTSHIDDKDYHISFASMDVKGTAYKLTLARRLPEEASHALGAIATRLIITGIVILWIAIWAALILSSWIARRLNEQNDTILYQALHDDLTGLPNRTFLFRNMNNSIQEIRKKRKSLVLFVLDLDRFKEINDTLGHGCGDELLIEISKRLNIYKDFCHTIARLGGDEFAILKITENKKDTIAFAKKISSLLDELITVNAFSLHIRTSMGIAMYPVHGKDAETLIRHAEIAMYKAKESQSGWTIYDAEEDPFSIRRLTLLGELRQAIENNQLLLHYQPKMDLNNHKVDSVEALVRWQHPKMDLIPPDEFITIAEQSGLIKPLTMWVIKQAIEDLKSWKAMELDISIAINISTHLFYDYKFPLELESLLLDSKISPQSIELEMTESRLMENIDNTMEALNRINKMGFSLSIDDFGTGFSSLAYLKRFPVDKLKIDKSFVLDMETNENDRSIVHAIVDLAHDLNYQVIAEGVENNEVINLLKEMNCDIVQGIYLSKPVPSDDFIEWLKNRKAEA
ncbi:MAG: EAL domain-containing protein [Deltaproteobacteria bacterium]|nr:EAL domain-containing protein [Deltaproteobacteria bacterium]